MSRPLPGERPTDETGVPVVQGAAPAVDLALVAALSGAAAIETFTTEAEWLAARRTGIGASEIAAVLGVSRFASPASVWADKCGLGEPLGEIERLRWGKRLQRPIADGFVAETGRELLDPGPYVLLRSTRYPWLVMSPDYFQRWGGPSKLGVLEIKNVGEYSRRDWLDEPPVGYQLQVQAQLLVTGLGWGTLAALIGGAELVFADLVRHADAAEWILDAAAVFWTYVQRETPPPQLDGSEQTTRALKRLYPTADAGRVVPLPEAAADWDRTIIEGEAAIAEFEERVDAAKNQLRAAIADAEAGRLPDGRVWTNKLETRKGYTKTVEPWAGRTLRRRAARTEGGQ